MWQWCVGAWWWVLGGGYYGTKKTDCWLYTKSSKKKDQASNKQYGEKKFVKDHMILLLKFVWGKLGSSSEGGDGKLGFHMHSSFSSGFGWKTAKPCHNRLEMKAMREAINTKHSNFTMRKNFIVKNCFIPLLKRNFVGTGGCLSSGTCRSGWLLMLWRVVIWLVIDHAINILFFLRLKI